MPNIKPTTPFNPTKYVPLTAIPICPLCDTPIERGSLNWTFSPTKERLGRYTGTYTPIIGHVWRHYDCANFNGKNVPSTNAPATPEPKQEEQKPKKWEPSWNQKEAEEQKEQKPEEQKPEEKPIEPTIQTTTTPKQIAVEHYQVAALERLIEFRLDPRCRKPDINIYLGGAPGAGKSYSIKNLAKRLRTHNGSIGLEYIFIALSDATMPSAIFGFQNANGDYCSTPFYQAYKNGGVLDIAELDNTNANVFTLLNNALDNGVYFFPGRNKDEAFHEVKRHKDCIVIGNGNTFLRGGTSMFPGRQAQDAAAIERFKFIHWKYDRKLENFLLTHSQEEIKAAVASYIPPPINFPPVKYNAPLIVSWLDVLGDKCETGDHENPKGHELVVSMRGKLNVMDCLDAGFTPMEALDMSIFKEYDKKSSLLKIHPLTPFA